MLLSNRVAIITGGAAGVGRATAELFAEEGCDVAIADINIEQGNKTLNRVKKKGRDGLAIECDVSDSAQVRNCVDQVISKFGEIDILVNSAGGGSPNKTEEEKPKTPSGPRSITDITDEDWDRGVGLNLTGAFYFCRDVALHMKEKRYGKIVNISTLGWIIPPMSGLPYHAAKAGVVGLSNDMVRDLSRHNIYVNTVLPGPIQTTFWDKIIEGATDGTEEAREKFFKDLGSNIPLGRVGRAIDVARAVLFYASDLSSFVTGTMLPVAGGLPITIS